MADDRFPEATGAAPPLSADAAQSDASVASEPSPLRVYGPALATAGMSALQAAFLVGQVLSRRCAGDRGHADDWGTSALWDDVACGVACAAVVTSLCYMDLTNVAWVLVAPIAVLGTSSTAYHVYEYARNAKTAQQSQDRACEDAVTDAVPE